MKHINIAMENMKENAAFKDEESRSIIERIVEKTGDPKIAAVLALDLFLVGVDTVRSPRAILFFNSIIFHCSSELSLLTFCCTFFSILANLTCFYFRFTLFSHSSVMLHVANILNN